MENSMLMEWWRSHSLTCGCLPDEFEHQQTPVPNILFSAYYVHLYFDSQLPVPVAPEGDSAAPPNVLRTPAGSFCAPSPAPHIARCTSRVHTAEKSQSPKDDIWETYYCIRVQIWAWDWCSAYISWKKYNFDISLIISVCTFRYWDSSEKTPDLSKREIKSCPLRYSNLPNSNYQQS